MNCEYANSSHAIGRRKEVIRFGGLSMHKRLREDQNIGKRTHAVLRVIACCSFKVQHSLHVRLIEDPRLLSAFHDERAMVRCEFGVGRFV
jgi:uncharacterized protein YwbE